MDNETNQGQTMTTETMTANQAMLIALKTTIREALEGADSMCNAGEYEYAAEFLRYASDRIDATRDGHWWAQYHMVAERIITVDEVLDADGFWSFTSKGSSIQFATRFDGMETHYLNQTEAVQEWTERR